jgi:hypothetical protein
VTGTIYAFDEQISQLRDPESWRMALILLRDHNTDRRYYIVLNHPHPRAGEPMWAKDFDGINP